MPAEDLLDLDRVHVLPARDDHVRRAVEQPEVVLGVEVPDVAHPVPAAGERGLRRRLVLPVATGDVRAADHDLADLTGRARSTARRRATSTATPTTGWPHDPRWPPSSVAFLVGEAGHDRRRLRRPVVLGELDIGERLVGPADQRRRDRRTGVPEQAQRRHAPRTRRLLVDERGEHRRHGHGDGDTAALDRVEARCRLEAGEHDERAPEPDEGQHGCGPGDVEERRRGEEHVVGPQPTGDRLVQRVGDEVAVAEHDALGSAGRTAREVHDGEVVLVRRRSRDRPASPRRRSRPTRRT